MATFPRPLCELRVLFGSRVSRPRSRRGVARANPSLADAQSPVRDQHAHACPSRAPENSDAGAPGKGEA